MWANTNLVPSLLLFISRGLTTPASPLLPTYIFPNRAVCTHSQPDITSILYQRTALVLSLTVSRSLSHTTYTQPRLLLLTPRLPRQRQSSLSLRQHLSWKNTNFPQPPTPTHTHIPTHTRMCDFTKNYYIYSSCLDPGAHFFRTSVDGNRKLACPKGPHERYIVQPGTCPLCSG